MRWVLLVAIVGCGRLGFDAQGVDAPGGPGRDSTTGGGDAMGDGGGGGSEAGASVCANAKVVTVGQRLATSTCVGQDLIDSCGPANTEEVVLSFTPPQTATYTVRAFDAGTNNVSNATSQLNAACTMGGVCTGITQKQFQAGTTSYFVVEASGGGCASIEFLID
jgi:hypothetical protein